MLRRNQPRSGRHHRRTVLGALASAACLFVWAAPAQANTSLFYNTGSVCTVTTTCWQAGDFGALVGLRDVANNWVTGTVNYSSGTEIHGEIGVGAGSAIAFDLHNTGIKNPIWDGPIDFADNTTGAAGPCTGTAGCHVPSGNTLTMSTPTRNVTVTGGTAHEPTQLQAAMNQMRDISAYWAGQSGTAVTNLGSGSNTFSGSGIHVYRVANNRLINTTSTITLTGDATSLFVFNIYSSSANGTIPVLFNNNITLNGIRSDQVFFNILGAATGSANYVMSNTTGTQNGVFYVAADSYSANTVINGRIFGGRGTDYWGANFILKAPGDVPSSIPEPSTYALMATGLGALLYAGKRRRS